MGNEEKLKATENKSSQEALEGQRTEGAVTAVTA